MKVLKVFTDFTVDMKELGDAERGRLFTAMLQYAATGIEPKLQGNERFVWGTAKKNIDTQIKKYDAMCDTNQRIATERNEALRSVTERDENERVVPIKDKEKDKEKDKDKEKENDTPHKPPKGGFDAFVKQAFTDFAGDDTDLLNALLEFAAMRKRIKSPIATEQTVTRLLNKLQTDFQRYEWVDVLNQSTDNNWKGIFPLKNERRQQRRQTSNPFVEMLKEERIEQF